MDESKLAALWARGPQRELPEPVGHVCIWNEDHDDPFSYWVQWHDANDPMPDKWDDAPSHTMPHYTADQMHAAMTPPPEALRAFAEAMAEECARVCESIEDTADAWAFSSGKEHDKGQAQGARNCAAAIRRHVRGD